jgi:glucokinase
MAGDTTYILAGDIGGTKTELALYPTPGGNSRAPEIRERFDSQEYASLEEIAGKFLNSKDIRLARACIGVAGPVVEGKSRITNLPWLIDGGGLAAVIGAPVHLVNDMDAIAHAVAHIDPSDLATLLPGSPVEQGARAIIAPGTGLGEGFLVWAEGRYQPYGTEGGHTDFAPRDKQQMSLLAYLQDRFDHVSYERVCSGMGLVNIFRFLLHAGSLPEPAWFREATDQAAAVSQAGLENRDETAGRALDLMVSIYGAEAGNLALKVMATAGVYVGGGIAPKILTRLGQGGFMRAFADKGRLSGLMAQIPVKVILNEETALLGAALCAAA